MSRRDDLLAEEYQLNKYHQDYLEAKDRKRAQIREAIHPFLFREIKKVSLVNPARKYLRHPMAIGINFGPKDDLFLWLDWDWVTDCTTYFDTDDDLGYFNGARLVDVVLNPAQCKESTWSQVHDIMFLNILTSVGVITFQAHNVHNGYYEGFEIKVGPEIKSTYN